MKDFQQWFHNLTTSDGGMWLELLRAYKDETIRAACKKVYDYCVMDEILRLRSDQETRKHIYNLLCKNPGDKVVNKNWHEKALKQEEEKKAEEWKPVSWEERKEWLKKWNDMLEGVADEKKIRPLFDGEAEEKGQYDLPRPVAKCAPSAPIEVAIDIEIHIQYLRENYDAITREKKEGWMSEEDWRLVNDYPEKIERKTI